MNLRGGVPYAIVCANGVLQDEFAVKIAGTVGGTAERS